MKKISLIGVVFILMVASVLPVMAKMGATSGWGIRSITSKANKNTLQNDNKNVDLNKLSGNSTIQISSTEGEEFSIQGTISAIDLVAGTITVALLHGDSHVNGTASDELTIKVTDGTMIFQLSQPDAADKATVNFGEDDVDDQDDDDMDDNDEDDLEDDDEDDMEDEDDREDQNDDLDDSMEDQDEDLDDQGEDIDERGEKVEEDMEQTRIQFAFDQLTVGQTVAVYGDQSGDVFTASLITFTIGLPSGTTMELKP
jgi:hypothetical protein